MELNDTQLYDALTARDPRFDGVFFVGVASTGIYCRPVCPARTPLRKNCTFYANPALAEQAGHRPCLRCRPELAPGQSSVDAVSRLAELARVRIESGALIESSLAKLAAELGVTDRHLRRVVHEEFGVTPVELSQTYRLLLAKRLLTDTPMRVIDVAYASGFASLRRMNALIKSRYGISPTQLRRAGGESRAFAPLVCDLRYREPYAHDAMLGFLQARATRGVEQVVDGTYSRTVRHGDETGWMSASFVRDRSMLRVTLSPGLASVLPQVLGRVRQQFDVGCNPQAVNERLGAIAKGCPGLRVPGAFVAFESCVRVILGQQISVAGATTLASRLAGTFGDAIETPHAGLTRLSPTPLALASAPESALRELGIISARVRTIQSFARAILDGSLKLHAVPDPTPTMERLLALPGIGPWTASVIAMRVLAWPDAFPAGDLGVMRALDARSPAEAEAHAEQWRPFRAYAALHLWRG
jgi:AraC family transcriptional regulator of adaptative response / DNA-3-methyladenine glycosylase II